MKMRELTTTVLNILEGKEGIDVEMPKFLQMEDIDRALEGLYLDDVAKGRKRNSHLFDDRRAVKALEDLPPADVVPGHCYRQLKTEVEALRLRRPLIEIQWLPQERGGMIWGYACSHCGHVDKDVFEKGRLPFCPMCGAVYVPEEEEDVEETQ